MVLAQPAPVLSVGTVIEQFAIFETEAEEGGVALAGAGIGLLTEGSLVHQALAQRVFHGIHPLIGVTFGIGVGFPNRALDQHHDPVGGLGIEPPLEVLERRGACAKVAFDIEVLMRLPALYDLCGPRHRERPSRWLSGSQDRP